MTFRFQVNMKPFRPVGMAEGQPTEKGPENRSLLKYAMKLHQCDSVNYGNDYLYPCISELKLYK